MKTSATSLKKESYLRYDLIKSTIIFLLFTICSSNIFCQTTPSELYKQDERSPFIVESIEYSTLYESDTLYHKENLQIYYEAIGFSDDAPGTRVELSTSIDITTYYIDGNEENNSIEFIYRTNTNQTIPDIIIPDECAGYKITIRAKSEGYITSAPRIRKTFISAIAATPKEIEVERIGDNSVYVKWQRDIENQRQRFEVELLKNDGSSLSPKVVSSVTEGNEAKFEYPLTVGNHKIRVNLYGDGENKSSTISSTETTELLYRSTSQFLMSTRSVVVNLLGIGDYKINILNASGIITHSKNITLEKDSVTRTKIIRDGATDTETLLDNEFRVQVISENLESSLKRNPIITTGNNLYDEIHLAQLASNIAGVFTDKFELEETMIDSPTTINSAELFQKEVIEFKLKNSTTQIELRTDTFATEGGYQAVIRLQAMRSNNGHTPKLEFFVADINNNIIADITSNIILVENLTLVDKVVTLSIPSSVNAPHKIIIRCTSDKQNPNVTCTIKNLRISRHNNIATNIQLSSCANKLNLSWSIPEGGDSHNNNYFAQILDETGCWIIGRSNIVTENKVSISLDQINLKSGTYKIRVISRDKTNTRLGTSALKTFTYIKAGDTFDTGSTTNIDYLMFGLEDNGNVGALNKVAQMTTTNTALSVNKVALQMKITSGQYYFVSFPFQPDSMYIDCAKALQGENIVIRGFDSEKYSVTPSNSNNFYPILGDGTTNIPFNSLERGKGYLMSVNTRATNNVKAEVYVTIIGNVSTQTNRYINYNLMELDMQGESVIEGGSGNGYGYKGWSLLSNPFPRTFGLENNFYVSVYKLPSLSSTGSNDDGKVAAAGYSVYRNTPGDVIPAFVPFFVQSDAATFAMKPNTIASSTANDLSKELRLNLSDGNSFDEVILNLDEEASQFYTIGKDLIKMSSMASGVPQISSRVGSETLVVRALTPEMALEGIPVELYAGKSGKQSLSIASSEWDGEYEYFIRNANGEEFILNDGAYEFDGVAGKTTKITFFARTMPLSVEDEIAQKVTVSQLGDAIEISAPEMIQNVKLFNLNGSLVKSSTPMSERSTINSVETGVYIVEIIMATSREVVKVVIQ